MQVLVIDNYDSFTYNLVELVKAVSDVAVTVLRNSDILPSEVGDVFDAVIISPGPGHPSRTGDVGASQSVLTSTSLPVLGVCLGHQLMAYLEGSEIAEAKSPMHGQVSSIRHDGDELFRGIPQVFNAVRYHSLEVICTNDRINPIAWAEDGTLMALRVPGSLRWGVQFHPESIGSEQPRKIVQNFLDIVRQHMSVEVHNRNDPKQFVQHTVAAIRNLPVTEMLEILPEPPRIILDGLTTLSGSACTLLGWTDGPHSSELHSVRDHPIEVISATRTKEILNKDVFETLETLTKTNHKPCLNEEHMDIMMSLGYAGFIGYEIGHEVLEVSYSGSQTQGWGLDAWFALVTRGIVIENETNRVTINWLSTTETCSSEDLPIWVDEIQHLMRKTNTSQTGVRLPTELEVDPGNFSVPEQEYLSLIERCQDEIRKGNSYELCLTNSIHGQWEGDFLSLFREIRSGGAVPYSAFLRIDNEKVVVSGSPELLLKVSPHGHAVSRPIKGTRPASDDARLRESACEELHGSGKDRAENLMIVDLVRHEFSQYAQSGSTVVTELFGIYKFPTVIQMISTIECDLRPETSPLDLLRSVFPPGSMTGAPKKRSVEILRTLEKQERGVYSGTIGHVGFDNQISFNVAIRTLEFSGNDYRLGVGGAITSLSDPDEEWLEVGDKAVASRQAMERSSCIRQGV